jgi:hypothetical protein
VRLHSTVRPTWDAGNISSTLLLTELLFPFFPCSRRSSLCRNSILFRRPLLHGVQTECTIVLVKTSCSLHNSMPHRRLNPMNVCIYVSDFLPFIYDAIMYRLLRRLEVLENTDHLLSFDTTRTAYKIILPCRGNVLTEPLPSNEHLTIGGIHIQTCRVMAGVYEVRRWEEIRFHKGWFRHSNVNMGFTDTHTWRSHKPDLGKYAKNGRWSQERRVKWRKRTRE